MYVRKGPAEMRQFWSYLNIQAEKMSTVCVCNLLLLNFRQSMQSLKSLQASDIWLEHVGSAKHLHIMYAASLPSRCVPEKTAFLVILWNHRESCDVPITLPIHWCLRRTKAQRQDAKSRTNRVLPFKIMSKVFWRNWQRSQSKWLGGKSKWYFSPSSCGLSGSVPS